MGQPQWHRGSGIVIDPFPWSYHKVPTFDKMGKITMFLTEQISGVVLTLNPMKGDLVELGSFKCSELSKICVSKFLGDNAAIIVPSNGPPIVIQ